MHTQSLIKQGLNAKQTAKTNAELKARNMVMLGDVATDRAKVQVAQAALKQVLHKISKKHPEYMMEAQGIQDFVSNDLLGESNTDAKIDGGFKKLQKILKKIDDLEMELQKELDDEEAKRKKNREDCQKEITDLEDQIAEKQEQLDNAQAKVHGLKGDNTAAQDAIRASRDAEGGSHEGSYESMTEKSLAERKEKYDEYWSLTDDSAASVTS
jgi:predicted  nucleic acid-binding Zn-ribbon protein